jgi:hypothetical protein
MERIVPDPVEAGVEVCSSMGFLLPCLSLLEGRVVWHRPVLLFECLETFLGETFSLEVEGLGGLVSECLECQCGLVEAFGAGRAVCTCFLRPTLVSGLVPTLLLRELVQ